MSVPRGVRAAFAALAVLLLPATGWSWGSAVHHFVAQRTSAHLPPWIDGLRSYDPVVDDQSTVPDERKPYTPGESQKHYIDIDAYPEFLAGTLPHDRAALEAIYGAPAVLDRGVLPWAIAETYAALVQRLRERDWGASALTIGDLCHYVADASQPLHCTANYDGQMTGQDGLHSRYESTMMGGHVADLDDPAAPARSLAGAREAGFACIGDSWACVAALLQADEEAVRPSSGVYDAGYYDRLWAATATMTRARIDSAVVLTASLVYSAWIDAGRPAVPGSSATWGAPAVALGLVAKPSVFREATRIDWTGPGPVTLDVLDVAGRRVARLAGGGGDHGTVQWPASAHAERAGVYFVRLASPAGTLVRRVCLLD